MSSISFDKQIKARLASDFPEKGALGGAWRGKSYEHILKVRSREDLIWEYNVLPAVRQIDSKEGRLLKGAQLHQCAHHLNSSQILCYNFSGLYCWQKTKEPSPNRNFRVCYWKAAELLFPKTLNANLNLPPDSMTEQTSTSI